MQGSAKKVFETIFEPHRVKKSKRGRGQKGDGSKRSKRGRL